MIDRQIFAHQMGILADRIGRDLKAPTLRAYYQALKQSLTTEQFVAATTLAFRTITGDYRVWPSPAQLIELVTPVADPTLSGADAFERVLAITNDPRIPIGERVPMIQELGAATVRAFRAAGGRREFENVPEDQVKWLRRSFLEAYTAACENADAERVASLALASASAQVRALVNATADKLSMPEPQRIAAGGAR